MASTAPDSSTPENPTSPDPEIEVPVRSAREIYRLSDSEIDSLRREFQESAKWMQEQLEIDPELKHL